MTYADLLLLKFCTNLKNFCISVKKHIFIHTELYYWQAVDMIAHLKQTFISMLDKAEWLDDATRKNAQKKVGETLLFYP